MNNQTQSSSNNALLNATRKNDTVDLIVVEDKEDKLARQNEAMKHMGTGKEGKLIFLKIHIFHHFFVFIF